MFGQFTYGRFANTAALFTMQEAQKHLYVLKLNHEIAAKGNLYITLALSLGMHYQIVSRNFCHACFIKIRNSIIEYTNMYMTVL